MGLKIYAITPETGTRVDLTDSINFSTLDFDSLGQPAVTNVSESGPQQHGATWVGYRLAPRLFPLNLEAAGKDFGDLMSKRQVLTEIFAPRDTPTTLQFSWDTLDSSGRTPVTVTVNRAIDCYFSDGLKFKWSDVEGYNQKATVILFAPDPAWYDPARQAFVMGAGAGGTPLAVPWTVNTFVGNSVLSQTSTLEYLGTWDEYPTVEFLGPITDPVLVNNSTGEKLDFTGTVISAGSKITVDTRYGYKTVLDEAGNWVEDKLTNDSNLATFHLSKRAYPNTISPQTLTATGTGITSSTRVTVRYYHRYLGI